MSDPVVDLETTLLTIRARLDKGERVHISPGGVSMLPMLHPDRDIVVLSPVHGRLCKYDLPLYRNPYGQLLLHRVVRVHSTWYHCAGDNQFLLEPGITDDMIIGVVTEFIRNGKHHTVTEPGYRLYCRVLHWSRPIRHAVKHPRNFLRRAKVWLNSKLFSGS